MGDWQFVGDILIVDNKLMIDGRYFSMIVLILYFYYILF